MCRPRRCRSPLPAGAIEAAAATRVMTHPAAPSPHTQTMPTLPDRGPSQIPFILTAFGLLTLLALLVFLVFRLASDDPPPVTELIEVPNVVGMTEAEAADPAPGRRVSASNCAARPPRRWPRASSSARLRLRRGPS